MNALFFVIGYMILFAVVWLHEIGHALWYPKFNLRKAWWKVQVKPYIFFSKPGAVDEKVWQNLTPTQYVLIAYGGIMANAAFAIISIPLIIAVGNGNQYLQVALWLFMTLHVGEIVSYLFIGSIFLVSDMKIVNQFMPRLRVPNLIIGTALTIAYLFLLINIPKEFNIFVIIWNIITVLSMCAGRIISTAKTK